MTQITAAMVKDLRQKTDAGMMDAKKALVEAGGDIEAAVDVLRKRGLAKAAKKSGRTAADGLVAIAVDGTKGAVVEINSETDFVARNEEFQNFAKTVSQIALGINSLEDLNTADYGNGKSVQDTLTGLIATIGENMTIRRMESVNVSQGAVTAYVHGELAPGLGKIGVLIGLESANDPASLAETGKKLAMHVAAANPQFLDRDSVDQDALERERTVLKEQAVASGKPPEIAEKMVEGRMRKFYEEVCFLDQTFVIDGESKVSDIIKNEGAKVTGYSRMELGDGIEKEEDDFASEVAKVAGA